MKKAILLLCCLSILLGCKTKNVKDKSIGKNVSPTEMNKTEDAQEKKAYELGKRVLTTCNTSTFTPYTTSEATEKVIANSTLKNIKKICEKYNEKYGAFKDLEFVEMVPNKEENTKAYRFKALFESADANKELRVTMNSENKVSAINTKDWKNAFE